MTFAAGQILEADDLNNMDIASLTTSGNVTVGGRLILPYECYVTADQASSANNTTYANVTDLVLPLAASTGYELDMFVLYAATTVADFKIQLTGPSGVDVSETMYWAPLNASWGSTASGQVVGLNGNGASTKVPLMLRGTIINGSTAGNLQVQVAKNTAEASTHTVYQWSWMRLRPLA